MEREQARKRLQDRSDVPDEDVDDVLEIAARRQEEARRPASTGATREELEAVARELDIDPSFLDGAVEELRASRAEAEAARVRAEEARSRAVRRVLIAAVAAVGVVITGGSVAAGGAWLASGRVDAAAAEAHAAEARLDAVLERQAALAPQLVALAGGDPGDLTRLAGAVRSAPTLDARREAASELSIAMAGALGQLPPAAEGADGTLRLQLYDEVSGGQNRVTVEARRYEEALAGWRDAASGGLAGLAVTLGMAEAPPGG